MTAMGGVPAAQGCGMRHMTKIFSKSPFVTTVATKVGNKLERAFWSPVCGQGCPIPSLECVRDTLGDPELMIPLVRDAIRDGHVSCLDLKQSVGRIGPKDVKYVEIALVYWDMDLLF